MVKPELRESLEALGALAILGSVFGLFFSRHRTICPT